MRRRAFISLLGGAAAWPLTARAQQRAMPIIGFLSPTSSEMFEIRLRGFRQGLKENGYVEGENVAIVYRWAGGHYDRLPELAAELASQQVAVIITAGGSPSALAAKAATTTIPIVFLVGEDAVRLGLVASLARPGGNLTGVNFFITELTAKRMEFLRELVPRAARVAVLVNPATVENFATMREVEAATRDTGLQIRTLHASTSREIDTAFASLVHERPDALFVAADPLFNGRRTQLILLAARYAIPATFAVREIVEAGGLMSYGASNTDAWRQMGVYTGRILKGAKPADLPVVQSTKFELVINLQTARVLGLEVPSALLARADEVLPGLGRLLDLHQAAVLHIVNIAVDRDVLRHQRMVADAHHILNHASGEVADRVPFDELAVDRARALADVAPASVAELCSVEAFR